MVGERRPRGRCGVCGRDVALTARRGLVGPHGQGGVRCAGAGSPPDGSAAGVVRLADAAALRDERRRLVLAERLAQVEVLSEAVARGSLELVSNALPAMLEALEATIKAPARDAASVLAAGDTGDTGDRGDAGDADAAAGMDGGLLEALVRADPQRARRVLDSLTGTTGGG